MEADPINFTDPLGQSEETITITGQRCGGFWINDYCAHDSDFGSFFRSPGPFSASDFGWGSFGEDTSIRNEEKKNPCPASPGQPFSTREQAAVAAVQAARAQQRAARDNNERSFRIDPLPGGRYTFRGFKVGTAGNVKIGAYPESVGAGHTHTAGGGDTLSRQLGSSDEPRDVENMTRLIEQVGRTDFLTILGAENGNVYAWFGRNLGGSGKKIGTDKCD